MPQGPATLPTRWRLLTHRPTTRSLVLLAQVVDNRTYSVLPIVECGYMGLHVGAREDGRGGTGEEGGA